MAESKNSLLSPKPGIQKDGTLFSSRSWTEGQWVRFQRGLPRKIGGYQQIVNNIANIPRKIFIVPNSPNFNVYVADYHNLRFFVMNASGIAISGFIDRTPVGFAFNFNNNWKLDTMFSTVANSSILIAHAAQNLASIDNPIETPIYYGNAIGTDVLTSTNNYVSGGFVVLHPYLFMFSNDGDVRWTEPNNPTTILGSARVCGSKIVAGFSSRGGNASPAGLLWALDSVIRITQVSLGGEPEFKFDTLTDESSILSSNSIVEYDGYYYWIGLDRFYVYNGSVQKLPNDMNLNFFFDNLNYQQRQKVWATKVPRFDEIWWHYPSKNSTECDSVIIYNVTDGSWNNSLSDRGAGYFNQIFTKPIWSDSPNAGPYSIWMHETGVNQVNLDGSVDPIDSHIISPFFSNCAVNFDGQFVGVDRNISLDKLEPDFIQTGNMTLTVISKSYANDVARFSAPITFTKDTKKIDLHIQGREIFFTFECSEVDSNFEMGQVIITHQPGDGRP